MRWLKTVWMWLDGINERARNWEVREEEGDAPSAPPIDPLSGSYPNGSVPYGAGEESLALRAKRFACAAVNHHPRRFDGSWCGGYGYVCGRCYMYADPIPQAQLENICEAINSREAKGESFYGGSYFGGGPPSNRIS